MDTFLEKTIGELNDCNFEIPPYQRGYRWEKNQIIKLLNDINEAKMTQDLQKKTKSYYLQPIILKEQKDKTYTLIDGQQRLTTLYIIMLYLCERIKKKDIIENEIYKIYYSSLNNGNDNSKINLKDTLTNYIANKDNEVKRKTLNHYYYYLAINIIKAWCDNKLKNDDEITNYLNFIRNNVKIIWYELNEKDKEDENEAFIRINTNKIALTQADLVKAEFLREDKFNDRQSKSTLLQMGKEWNEIENALFDDSFWFFISNIATTDRMTELLKITYDVYYKKDDKKKDKDENNLFSSFQKQIENKYDETWNNIKETFNVLKEWYNNIKLYNIIGFIVTSTENNNKDINEWIVNAIKQYKGDNDNTTKISFENFLKDKIQKNLFTSEIRESESYKNKNINEDDINEFLSQLNYKENKKEIKNILILHNILTLNDIKDNKTRFSFEKYKNSYYLDEKKSNEKPKKIEWDIEHISSQHDAKIKTDEDKKAYIDYLQKYYTNKSLKEKIDHEVFIEKISILKKLEYNKIQENEIKIELDKDIQIKFDKDQIGNLVLLDSNINRSYGNSLFMKKREEIIEKDEERFIPICTKKAFLKAFRKSNYSNTDEYNFAQNFEWNLDDVTIYTNDIVKKLYNGIYKGDN